MALGFLRLLQHARLQGTGGLGLAGMSQPLRADPWQVQEVLYTLVQLDWVGVLNEPQASRYALLIDLASTRAAPLMNQLLLNDNAQTQAVWARWKDWCVAELV